MSTKKTQEEREEKIKTESLRSRAKERFESLQTDVGGMLEGDVRKLAQELQIHQIELEIQNEEFNKRGSPGFGVVDNYAVCLQLAEFFIYRACLYSL